MSVVTDLDPVSGSPRRALRGAPPSTGQALSRLDDLLLRPADTGTWWTSLARGVSDLTDALWEDRTLVAGPGGLHQELVDEEPRLCFQARRLESERAGLVDDLARLPRLIASCMGRSGGTDVVLSAAKDVVGRIRVHERRASSLMHEAYQRDLGGGD